MSGIMVWNGSDWVLKPVKFWDGSAWKYKKFCFWTGTEWKTSADLGPAAPVHVNSQVTSYASRNDLEIVAPVGLADKHIMLATTFQGDSTAPPAPVPPSGWTQLGSYVEHGTGGFFARFAMWWKRAGPSEPLSYTWAFFQPAMSQATVTAYSNCEESGSPVDVMSESHALGPALATAVGVTTTEANTMLVWLGHNWDASQALSPPAGMAERIDHLTYIADQVIAAAGATGDRTQTQVQSAPWVANLVALKGK